VKGRVYAVKTRNLVLGIYTGDGDENVQWFKGIRTKFDYKYATEELGIAIAVGGTYSNGKGGILVGGFDPGDIVLLGDLIKLGEFAEGSQQGS